MGWAMKRESRKSNKIRNMILPPIYLCKDQSHHSPLLPTTPAVFSQHSMKNLEKIQQFLFTSPRAIKIPSSMFNKQAKTEVNNPLASRHGDTGTLTPSMALLIHPSSFPNLAAASGDLWHLRICWSCGNWWNDIIDKLTTTFSPS